MTKKTGKKKSNLEELYEEMLKENDENDTDIYRGISYRKFNRKFTLADDIVVNDASLENGMLNITLERIVPEERKPKLIKVK